MKRDRLAALAYGTVCLSYNQKFLFISIICIPILLAILPVYTVSIITIPRSGRPPTNEGYSFNKEKLLTTAHIDEIVVSPDNHESRLIMGAAGNELSRGTVVFMENAVKVADYFTKADSEMKNYILFVRYGVNFEMISPERLEYTLRDTYSKDFRTTNRISKTATNIDMDRYYFSFLPLQVAINEAFAKVILKAASLPEWNLKPFPQPLEDNGDGNAVMRNTVVPLILALSIALGGTGIMIVFAQFIVKEKESGIREMMKLHGVSIWGIYGNWFTQFSIITTLIAAAITVLWKCIDRAPVLIYFDGTILFLCLAINYWSGLCSVGFASTLVNNPKYASVAGLYWIYGYGIAVTVLHTSKNTVALIVLALLPNGGMIQIVGVIAAWEFGRTTFTYSDLYVTPPTYENALPLGIVLLIMLIGMLIHFILMLYMDVIKPGPYGRAKPWHFIFPKRAKVGTRNGAELDAQQDSQALIEEAAQQRPVGIESVKVVKVFGSITAVDNLSIKFPKNQITVLLGHNGAGKTTFFSIICGMYSPTSGSVYTENYNVFEGKNIDTFRRELGYCPQHDILLDQMTVRQHLIFFGMLKGFTHREAKQRCDEWTNLFNLYQSRGKRVAQLSGGMKRKLCMSIAMIGYPKYLLLDEPTSGLDTESRRAIWDVLLAIRGFCTVIITTHSMEEADVLGDQIAIIAEGQLKCFGSTMFLKQHFGAGYVLNCSLEKKESENCIATVLKYVPSTKVVSRTNNAVSFMLPVSEIRKFPGLFQALESKFGKLMETSISYTSMDDVFLKVQESVGVQSTVKSMPMVDVTQRGESQFIICQQLRALITKKVRWCIYYWKYMVFIIIVAPLFGMCSSVWGCNGIISREYEDIIVDLSLTLDAYKGSIVLIGKRLDGDKVADFIESTVAKSGCSYTVIGASETMIEALLESARKNMMTYLFKTLCSIDTRSNLTAYYSTTAYHSAPIAYGMLFNAILQDYNSTITTHNYPYTIFQKNECRQSYTRISSDSITLLFMMVYGLIILTITSSFIDFPHQERTTNFKHLQLMTGLLPIVYWLTNFFVDFLLFCSMTIFSVFAIIVSDSNGTFLAQPGLNWLLLLLLLYGISSIFSAYFCSYVFKRNYHCSLFYLLVSLLGTIAFLFFSLWLRWDMMYSYFLPWAVLTTSVYKICDWCLRVQNCKRCGDYNSKVSCEEMVTDSSPIDLGQELAAFGIVSALYLILTLLLDHLLWFIKMACARQKIHAERDDLDPDVINEKKKVESAKENSEDALPAVVICDGLGKRYNRRTAVYDVTFAVQQGECFGLLGVNGAGKTTTFGMLAALIAPSQGDALVMKHKLSRSTYKYMKQIGYCPQFEGLCPQLSARSLITFFGRLRGVPSSLVHMLTDKWLEALDMKSICDRPCKTYSGGNKRKLSTAMALIGNPPVVLLDEPSSGVDPIARRKLWEILKHCLEKNGQTIVITSHSMDECEVICGRLTIMVEGVMKCIGTVPRLKRIFGKGLILQVKLVTTCTDEEAANVQHQIEAKFEPHIQLQDKQHSLFTFCISLETIKLHTTFEVMINIKSTNQNIEDFTLTSIPLEQVFISFAKGRTKNESKGDGSLRAISS